MKNSFPILTYKTTWEDWEKGRAYRRALAKRVVKNAPLRRESGDPIKDRILRELNDGQRGMPFAQF